MFVKENYKSFIENVPQEVILVAVSKTKPISDIQAAYDAGQRIFGENKVQEMIDKYDALPKDIQWHMIGHLQRNKVKYMAHFVELIHGVDSFKTLQEINKQAQKHNRIIHCLLQVKIAKEESKFGFSFEDVKEILNSDILIELEHIKVTGLMGMASFSDDMNIVSKEFNSLKTFFDKAKTTDKNLSVLSMGMTGDYKIAIKNGSNMIRVGSAIFGERHYLA